MHMQRLESIDPAADALLSQEALLADVARVIRDVPWLGVALQSDPRDLPGVADLMLRSHGVPFHLPPGSLRFTLALPSLFFQTVAAERLS